MANAVQTRSLLDDMLIKDVAQGIEDDLPGDTKMFDMFSVSPKTYEKNGLLDLRIQTKRNRQRSSYSENGNLPQTGAHEVKKFTIERKRTAIGFALTGDAIRTLTADANMAGDILAETEEDIKQSLSEEYNRQIYGTGTGRMGLLGPTFDASTLTLDGVEKARFFDVGDFCSLQTAATSVSKGTFTVTAVDYSTGVLTIDTNLSGTAADNDIIVRALQGTGDAAAAHGIDLIGLGAHLDDGSYAGVSSYQGVTRSDSNMYKANVVSNGNVNRALTEDLLYEMKLMRVLNSSRKDEDPSFISMEPGMLRTFSALFEGQVRFMPGKINAGLESAPTWDGIPLDVHMDHPYNQIFHISRECFQLYVGWPMKFLDEDGILHLDQSGNADKDNFKGWYLASFELGNSCPPASTALVDVTQSIFYRTSS